MDFKQDVCEKDEFKKLIVTLARQIRDKYADDIENLAFVGIKTRGVPIAERLSKEIKKLTKVEAPVGVCDISAFRDDKLIKKDITPCEIPFDVEGKHIVLIDDVLYTGRTMRAGVSAILSFGRPASISVGVMADRRGFLEMPIYAEFIGVKLDTLQDDVVSVSVKEVDKEDSIKIYSY